MMFCFVFKSIMLLLKPVLVIAVIMTAIITVGAFIAAVFDVFPVGGIILATVFAIIVISVVAYKVVVFVKDKKEEKLFRESEENRRRKLNKELEKHRGI